MLWEVHFKLPKTPVISIMVSCKISGVCVSSHFKAITDQPANQNSGQPVFIIANRISSSLSLLMPNFVLNSFFYSCSHFTITPLFLPCCILLSLIFNWVIVLCLASLFSVHFRGSHIAEFLAVSPSLSTETEKRHVACKVHRMHGKQMSLIKQVHFIFLRC
jgi:hypothetical protein